MRNLMKHVLLLNQHGGGEWTPTYLFRDEFSTDASAPLTSPRTAEPGPGTWTITGGTNTTIAAGELRIEGTDAVTITGSEVTRAPGLVVCGRVRRISDTVDRRSVFGAVSNAHSMTFGENSSRDVAMYAGTNKLYYDVVLDTWMNYAIVARETAGYFAFIDNVLQWVDYEGTENISVNIDRKANRANIGIDTATVYQLPAPFTTDFGIALLNVASPVSGTEYTGDADAIIDLTVTAPGTLDGEATTRCGFYYRADADLTPAWHCYVDGTGAFRVDSIAANGTRTNRINVAGVMAGGGTRTLRVICDGSLHNAYSQSGGLWTDRGAQIDLSLNDTATTIKPEVPAGWSAANLRCYPRTSSAYNVLDLA